MEPETKLGLSWVTAVNGVAGQLISLLDRTSRHRLACTGSGAWEAVQAARNEGRCMVRSILRMVSSVPRPGREVAPILSGQSALRVEELQGEKWRAMEGIEDRFNHRCVVWDGRLWVVGGSDCDNKALRRVEVYDPATREWGVAAELNTAREFHSCVVLEGRLWVVGGKDDRHRTLDSLEVYDPASGRWIQSASRMHGRVEVFLASNRSKNAAQLFTLQSNDTLPVVLQRICAKFKIKPKLRKDSALYTQQGALVTEPAQLTQGRPLVLCVTPGDLRGLQRVAINYGYDDVLPMCTPRSSHGCVALNGKLWVVGGQASDSSTLDSVEVYDPITGVWTPVARLNSARCASPTCEVVEGKLWVLGGVCRYFVEPEWMVEVYNPATERWSEGPRPSRSFAAAVPFEDRLWLCGQGTLDDPAKNLLEVYDPETGAWSDTTNPVIGRHYYSDWGQDSDGEYYTIQSDVLTMEYVEKPSKLWLDRNMQL